MVPGPSPPQIGPVHSLDHLHRVHTMKKIVLTFGLISGVILATLMSLSMAFHDELGGGGALGMAIGYTAMVLSGLLIYFGVRQCRDTIDGGTIRFWRAAKVGGLIAFIAATCYVGMWEVTYRNFMPDFMEKYSAQMLEDAKAAGATPEAIEEQRAEMAVWAERYKNPAIRIAITYMEPLPVALIMVFGSAWLLSRKKREELASASA